MSTMNLSPKNPIVVIALAGAAIWLLSRRTASATQLRPTTNTAVHGTIAPAIEALRGIVSIFSTPTTSGSAPGVPDEAARAAVRAGDPYYGGAYMATGVDSAWLDQMQSDADAWKAMNYDTGSTGDPYNPDGGYWLN